MEWPSHRLLLQARRNEHAAHGPLSDLEDLASTCSSSRPDLDATVVPSYNKWPSFPPYTHQASGISSDACAAALDAAGGSGGAGGAGASGGDASRRRRARKDWRRKCSSYSRLGGWYVLLAEILGTIILIALCVVAANQARTMSEEVETVALAALARSNPRAICVNASTDSVQGRMIAGANLQLVPSSFKEGRTGIHLKRASMEPALRLPQGLWNIPLASPVIPLDAVFTQSMLAAMYKCGIVRGAYHSQDLPSFIARRCSQCRTELGASLNASSTNVSFTSACDDINAARAHPKLEVKSASYSSITFANSSAAGSLTEAQLHTLLQAAHAAAAASGASLTAAGVNESVAAAGLAWVNGTANLLLFADDAFLPGMEASPHTLDQTLGSSNGGSSSSGSSSMSANGEFAGGLLSQLPLAPALQWMETSLYLSEEAWRATADHGHTQHLDPRLVPAGTLRVDVLQSQPYNGWQWDTGKARTVGQHVGSIFLELAQQTPKTAHCMAETAHLAVKLLRSSRFTLRAPNGTVMPNLRPRDVNVTFEQLWLRLDAHVEAARYKWACAEGVDVTASDATASLTRLDAYKSTAKAQYRTTIFLSMTHQTAEDVYAVYTGALGAVFGSFALLVSTLFVYCLALAQRILTDMAAESKDDAEHTA